HDGEFGCPQTLEVDFEAVVDWSSAADADDPALLPLDYHQADAAIGALLSSHRWNLIESVAAAIAELLLATSGARAVRVRVRKRPMGMPHAAGISAECVRPLLREPQ
ncbi:MAG: dihydroneopterin aldolase, partial [Myxococcota bacterium]|nr:dihydroneopterin aldolase [Myxococcota bacterium]